VFYAGNNFVRYFLSVRAAAASCRPTIESRATGARIASLCAWTRARPTDDFACTGSLGRWCRLGIWGTALYCTTFSTLRPTLSVVLSIVYNDLYHRRRPPQISLKYVFNVFGNNMTASFVVYCVWALTRVLLHHFNLINCLNVHY